MNHALNAAVGAPLLDHIQVRPGMEPYWRALKNVLDPELPISLVDMGLIYDIEARDDEGGARLLVTMTFTATACPCMSFMKMDIRDRLLQEPGVTDVDIETVWTPAWTRAMLTDEGRAQLRKYGVAA